MGCCLAIELEAARDRAKKRIIRRRYGALAGVRAYPQQQNQYYFNFNQGHRSQPVLLPAQHFHHHHRHHHHGIHHHGHHNALNPGHHHTHHHAHHHSHHHHGHHQLNTLKNNLYLFSLLNETLSINSIMCWTTYLTKLFFNSLTTFKHRCEVNFGILVKNLK